MFEVKSADPVIVKRTYDAAMTFFAGLITGLVLGIWGQRGRIIFMRIGIDGRCLQDNPRTGVGEAAFHLIKKFGKD